MKRVLDLIPQRPPFLFIDAIVELANDQIKTALTLSGDEPFFQGHFPNDPIMPGVLLQEALFQSAAALMSERSRQSGGGLGVVTKVSNARFKDMVRPPGTLVMEVSLTDQLENAYYFKGKTQVNGKVVAAVEFTCALVPATKEN